MSEYKEQNVQITFNGFTVDLFTTETGNLGMTVEKVVEHVTVESWQTFQDAIESNPSVDIFVDKDDVHKVHFV